MCMKELFELGGTKEEVEGALRIMPFVSDFRLQYARLSILSYVSASCHGSRCGRTEIQRKNHILLSLELEHYLHHNYSQG